MKKIIRIGAYLVFVSLLCLPSMAEAHWRGGGGRVFWGFGAGLLTGYLFAPRTVVMSPPAYPVYSPVYPAPYVAAPAAAPRVYGYSESVPQPGAHAKCREWRLLERHYRDTWDSYSGRWRALPVEKWGWVEVPCAN
jgi:hypothetical protein